MRTYDKSSTSVDVLRLLLAASFLLIISGFYLMYFYKSPSRYEMRIQKLANTQEPESRSESAPINTDSDEKFYVRDNFDSIDTLNNLQVEEKKRKKLKLKEDQELMDKKGDFDKMSQQERHQMLEEAISSLKISREEVRTALDNAQLASGEEITEYIQKSDNLNYKPPLNFLTNITNPCFLEKCNTCNRRVVKRCLPYFYLAGFPKCGTTDLWERLSQHPQVAPVDKKENHWWTSFRLEDPKIYGAGNMTLYTEFFSNVTLNKRVSVAGDGSASTSWKNYPMSTILPPIPMTVKLDTALREHKVLAVQLIRAYTPDAKFILILRNPVDRLYSDYLYFTDNATSPEDFHENTLHAMKLFFECVSEHSIRFCAYDRRSLIRIQNGLYAIFINDMLKSIPSENLMVINFEQYVSSRRQFLWSICDFLGLKMTKKTAAAMDMDVVFNQTPKSKKIGPMLDKTRQLLNDFYKPFTRELARIMENEEFLWD